MAVNGIELAVGQKWRTRGGEVVTIFANDGHSRYPWDIDNGRSVTNDGLEYGTSSECDFDLIELVEDVAKTEDAPKPKFAVGQKWRTRKGLVATLTEHLPGMPYPWVLGGVGTAVTASAEGRQWNRTIPGDFDLIELVEDVPKVEFISEEPADAKADADALASETLQALGYRFDGLCWVQDAPSAELPPTESEPHSHYKKDVRHLDFVDVYRVLVLYKVTDPGVAHAIKKLLCAGGRGAGKSFDQDIQEAIDSLQRVLGMRAEDAKGGAQ